MSKATPDRKKPRITVQVEHADKATIAAAVARWTWVNEADILRTALRVGLRALAQDPGPLGTPPVPAEDVTPSRTVGGMTTGTFERAVAASPKEDTPPSARAALVDFAMDGPPKGKKKR